MRDKPVFLNLFAIAFPITAIASILHRLSGLILFFMIPALLRLLQNSLYSSSSFSKYCKAVNNSFSIKLIVVFFLAALVYHLLAGIRHLIMDCGYGESKKAASISSYFVIISTVIFSMFLGYRLC